MNKEMLDLAAWPSTPPSAPAPAACSVRHRQRAQRRDQLPRAQAGDDQGGLDARSAIDLYVDGRYSAQGTSDLRPEALQALHRRCGGDHPAAGRGSATARCPTPSTTRGGWSVISAFSTRPTPQYKAADRHEAAKAIEAAALEKGGEKIISVTARAQDGLQEEVRLTSNGFQGFSEGTYFVAGRPGDPAGRRRPAAHGRTTWRSPSTGVTCRVPKPSAPAASPARRALLGGRKITTETLPIIVENRNVPPHPGRPAGGHVGPRRAAEAVLPGRQEGAEDRQRRADADRRPLRRSAGSGAGSTTATG